MDTRVLSKKENKFKTGEVVMVIDGMLCSTNNELVRMMGICFFDVMHVG